MVSGMARADVVDINQGNGVDYCQVFLDLKQDFKELKCDYKDLKTDKTDLKSDEKDLKCDENKLDFLLANDGCSHEIKELRMDIKCDEKDICTEKTDIKDEKHDICDELKDIKCDEHELHCAGFDPCCHGDPAPLPPASSLGGAGLLMAGLVKWMRSRRMTIA